MNSRKILIGIGMVAGAILWGVLSWLAGFVIVCAPIFLFCGFVTIYDGLRRAKTEWTPVRCV